MGTGEVNMWDGCVTEFSISGWTKMDHRKARLHSHGDSETIGGGKVGIKPKDRLGLVKNSATKVFQLPWGQDRLACREYSSLVKQTNDGSMVSEPSQVGVWPPLLEESTFPPSLPQPRSGPTCGPASP